MKKSLSTLAKEEILLQEHKSDCCSLAFLSAVIHSAGSLLIGGKGKLGVAIRSHGSDLYKNLKTAIKNLNGINIEFSGNEIKIKGENIISMLIDCGILRQDEELSIVLGIDSELIKNECCASSYAGGAFVGGGNISASKSGYHLEYSFAGIHMAEDLISLLAARDIFAKHTVRRGKYIVYLKDNDSINDCLAFCRACQTALHLSGLFVNRQVRQQSNRRLNCDMANLDRTVSAGVRQAEIFVKIVDKLSEDKLTETAKVRIQNPEASYEQLAEILKISKSGVKHRLKKLEEIAAENGEGGKI